MTEAERAALWRANREAREAAVKAANDARTGDAAYATEHAANWQPLIDAIRESRETESLDDEPGSPNVWEPE